MFFNALRAKDFEALLLDAVVHTRLAGVVRAVDFGLAKVLPLIGPAGVGLRNKHALIF